MSRDHPWRVSAKSCAAFLAVDMPTVANGRGRFSRVSRPTPPLARLPRMRRKPRPPAVSRAEVPSTSPDFRQSFFYSREDRARFAGMDEALRMNLIRSTCPMVLTSKSLLAPMACLHGGNIG